MNTEDKLKHFLDISISDAKAKAEKMLADYESALAKTLEDHKSDSKRRQAMRIDMESDKITRDGNKQLAVDHIELRKQLGKKQEELKEKLFVELKDKLDNYMETPAYHELLEKQIADAVAYAGDDEIVIYMDPADEDQIRRLSLHHSAMIKVSKYSFMGGTRAVIAAKNILIDNSFETKLAEAKEKFHFDLGGKANE